MIAVLAGSKRQFNDWLKPWINKKEDFDKFFYVGKEQDIRGIKFTEIIRIGTWYENQNCNDMESLVMNRIVRSRR